MIGRRALGAAALLPLLAPRQSWAAMPAPPPGGELKFNVIRGNSQIGTHVLRFTPAGDGLDIAITVRVAVRLGPIVAFRYEMDAVERWRGGALVELTARANDDGDAEHARVVLEGGALRVTGSQTQPYVAPPNALPATHWNMNELRGPLINPQDGKLFRPTVQQMGVENLPRTNGQAVQARHFKLTGDLELDLWYDQQGQWSGLAFTASDNSQVRYALV